jgi:hypothetical protein
MESKQKQEAVEPRYCVYHRRCGRATFTGKFKDIRFHMLETRSCPEGCRVVAMEGEDVSEKLKV